MHHPTTSNRGSTRRASSSPLAVSALCTLACVAGAGAQDLLAPSPPGFSGAPQNQPQGWPRGLGQAPANLVPEPTEPLPPLFQSGPVQVRPHMLYRFTYADGLPAGGNGYVSSIINQVQPGVLFDLGTHWFLDYTPTLRYYSNNKFQDTLDQSVSLTGAFTHGDSTFGFSQRYYTASSPLIETGGQTGIENYTTALTFGHQLGAKTSLDGAINQTFRYIDNSDTRVSVALQDSKQWSTLDWLNYQFQPRFGAALGVGGGYLALSASPDSAFQQVMGRINWHPMDVLTFVVSGGIDERQFMTNNVSDLLTPIFSAAAIYTPTPSTLVSVSADRAVSPSLQSDLIIQSTEVVGRVQQTFFKKLTFTVSAGYREVAYDQTVASLGLSREDDITFVNARLSLAILKRGTIGIFFGDTENSSVSTLVYKKTYNLPSSNLTSHQVGFDLGYRF